VSDGFTMCVACYGVNGEHEYSNCVYAPPPDPLATLRAEVERLRDGYRKADDARVRAGLGMSTQLGYYEDAYNTVLDLIDKQREGQ